MNPGVAFATQFGTVQQLWLREKLFVFACLMYEHATWMRLENLSSLKQLPILRLKCVHYAVSALCICSLKEWTLGTIFTLKPCASANVNAI